MNPFSTRFAPSPTGLLHLGHAASALYVQKWANKHDADLWLRIEDIDQTRCKPQFETTMLDDLRWLGLHWKNPVRRQSEHLADYAQTLEHLRKLGLLYRCFLTRRQWMEQVMSAPHTRGQVYVGPKTPLSATQETAFLDAGKAFAWRLSMTKVRDHLGPDWDQLVWQETGHGPDGQTGTIRANPDLLGDVILARKDIRTSYHLAVCHDDAAQNISHIIRGQDLFDSTHIHVLLQTLMGWPTPVYHHHGLVLDTSGKRLAKRDGATSLQQLRKLGMSAAQVRKQAMV